MNLLMRSESRRQSCLKIDLFSGDGVVEIQKLGMQEISSIAREAGEILSGGCGRSTGGFAHSLDHRFAITLHSPGGVDETGRPQCPSEKKA
jgi:hypothetical protein